VRVGRGAGLIVVLLLASGVRSAMAQQPMAYLERGIGSYRALEFDSAAGWLRRALTPPLVEALPVPEQVRGLAYLGATERFRGRSDSAASAFRRMLRIDPSSRPDPLIFPPEVTALFDEVRVSSPIVALSVPSEGVIDPWHPLYPIELRPSVPHRVTVTLQRTDGATVDTIYSGPVADSLTLGWDGRDPRGAPTPSGRYQITSTSDVEGPRGCIVRIPLQITSAPPDTLTPPPPLGADALLPERADGRTAPAAVAAAALLSAAALAFPAVSEDADPASSYVLVGAFSVTGVLALIRFRPGHPIPENVAANAAARARWQRDSTRVATLNQERVKRGKMVLQSSSPVSLGCGAP
jgi:hypothetical protein